MASRELDLPAVAEFRVEELVGNSFYPGVVANLLRQLNADIGLGHTLFTQDIVELGIAGDLHDKLVGFFQAVPEQFDPILEVIDGNNLGFGHVPMDADFPDRALGHVIAASQGGYPPKVTPRRERLGGKGLGAGGKGSLADQLLELRVPGNFQAAQVACLLQLPAEQGLAFLEVFLISRNDGLGRFGTDVDFQVGFEDRKSTRLNSSHVRISY